MRQAVRYTVRVTWDDGISTEVERSVQTFSRFAFDMATRFDVVKVEVRDSESNRVTTLVTLHDAPLPSPAPSV